MASKKFGVTFLSLPDNLFPDQTLPREGSSDFPRLIDEAGEFCRRVDSTAEMELNDLRLPDMIVTVLNNYDKKVLKAFLDPNHENIALYRCENSKSEDDFFIKKQGKFLSCGFIKRIIYGNETSMHGTLVFEYTIQQSGRWRPEHCGFAAVSRPYFHFEDMQRKGMQLAIEGLYFKWWQDTKFVKIEVIGLDANDTAAANLQNVLTEPDPVNPFTTAPTASDLNFKPKAHRYGFIWNGFNEKRELCLCQDEQCQFCARQGRSRWHGLGKPYDGNHMEII